MQDLKPGAARRRRLSPGVNAGALRQISVNIPTLGIGPLEDGVQLSRQQRGFVTMLKLEHEKTAHHSCFQSSACWQVGIHFELDRQHLASLPG